MNTSQYLLRSTALSIFTVSLVCSTAQAQLFRRSGEDQAAKDRAKQANTRDGKTTDPRQAGTLNNSANSKAQPSRVAQNSPNRNSGPNNQANPNGQATRQNNPYAKSPNSNSAQSTQTKVGSGLANKPTTQSRPQTSTNVRPQSSNATAVPRTNLSNQGRSNPPSNTQAVPQPPAFFGHQPVPQPTPAQLQNAQSLNTQLQRQQSAIANNNSGPLVAKEGTSPEPSAEAGIANLEGPNNPTNNASEAEIFSRFGVQLSDEDEALWVSNLTASGNGQSAGLNRKDKIVSLGGAPLTSKAEFVEISKLLSVGDQIEIEFERNGKPEKSMIFYGQASKEQANGEGSIQLEDNNNNNNNWSTTPTDPTERLERLVAEQKRVIAELQNRIRQLESQSKTAF